MTDPTKRPARLAAVAIAIAITLAFSSAGPIAPSLVAGDDGPHLYRERIAPVLKAQCYTCHSAASKKLGAGLRLDSREAMLEGGDSGPAVVPGKPDESLILQAIRHQDGLAMPPKKPKLSEPTIAEFTRWIQAGAPFEGSGSSTTTTVRSPLQMAREHWAFRPVVRPPVPEVADREWIKNPIDAFVLAKLESKGWRPAPPASRAEWLRRVTFDITGLPPSPDELDAFEHDRSPAAEERVVDRLLASPHFGERWAQHWLDVVRYAESEGFEYDRHIPEAWRFRDYVIDACNADRPFDRFVIEQLAGDELSPTDRRCQAASIFHRIGPIRRNAGNPEIALSRNEVLTERTDIIGTAFLGLTVGCARCHNHKLEPISQKDYYRLEAYLAATQENDINIATEAQRKTWLAKKSQTQQEVKALKAKLKGATEAERARLILEIAALEESIPPHPATIPAIRNDPKRRTPMYVLKRGVWEHKGEAVGPRPPSVLVPDSLPELPPDVADPRTRLARWLASPSHPLTSRVIVNRLWQHHFGVGIVKTANDFGTHGDRPSHPELLDWLAARLVDEGWRLKPIHRMILLSAAYRQSSHPDAQTTAVPARDDPENRLLWKFRRRRLEAEEVRDAMLSASGRLNPKSGGPSVMVPVDRAIIAALYKPSQWQVARDPAEHDRRSIYLTAKRNLRLPIFEAFDAPSLTSSCPRRESSTHAPQALELLNGRTANDLASAFAARLRRETRGVPSQTVRRGYRLALGRPPTPREEALALEFLRDGPIEEFALALFNLNGFLYVP